MCVDASQDFFRLLTTCRMRPIDTTDSICRAGMELVAEDGLGRVSVRRVATRAGVPAPTLQHHFPTKAALMLAIFARTAELHAEHSRAALDLLRDHAPGTAGEDLSLRRELLLLLRGWRAPPARAATGALLQFLAHAARDPALADVARGWLLETGAAIRQCPSIAMDEAAFLLELLVGMALVGAPSGDAMEQDILDRELIDFALGGAAGGWLSHFRATRSAAGPAPDPAARGAVSESVLDAGIAIVAESGFADLTYRRTAARAGVAASSVLYNFPTRQDLMMAIYAEIHHRLTVIGRLPAAGAVPPEDPRFRPVIRAIVGDTVSAVVAGRLPLVAASWELLLAGWREPEFAPQMRDMRLARGGSGAGQAARQQMVSHFLSVWWLGLYLIELARSEPDSHGRILRRLETGLDIVGIGSPRG